MSAEERFARLLADTELVCGEASRDLDGVSLLDLRGMRCLGQPQQLVLEAKQAVETCELHHRWRLRQQYKLMTELSRKMEDCARYVRAKVGPIARLPRARAHGALRKAVHVAASGSLIEEARRQHGVLSFRVAKNRTKRKEAERNRFASAVATRVEGIGELRTRHSLLKEQALALQRERTYCGLNELVQKDLLGLVLDRLSAGDAARLRQASRGINLAVAQFLAELSQVGLPHAE